MDLCGLMFPASYPEMGHCKSLLLTGAKGSCKTSLLFQIATSLSHQRCKKGGSRSRVGKGSEGSGGGSSSTDSVGAGGGDDDDCTIMFISNYKFAQIPLHVHRMPQFDAVSAKNVSIQYLTTYADLIAYLANLFCHVGKLSGIIIDGIDSFLRTIDDKTDGAYRNCLAKLFALLVDLGGYYSSCEDGFVRPGNDPCPVIAAFDSAVDEVYEKVSLAANGNCFFEQVCRIEPCTILGSRAGFKMSDSTGHRLYYYVDEGQIYLDKITFKTVQ